MTTHARLLWLTVAVTLMLACTKRPPTDNARATPTEATRPPAADPTPAAETREYRDGIGKIQVVYQTDGLMMAQRVSGTDTSRVLLRGVFQPDGIIGGDSCLLVNNKGVFTQGSGYALNDSLFLLTVSGTNWRKLLFGINFKTKTLLKTSGPPTADHLETYVDAFVYNAENQQIITSGRVNEYDDEGLKLNDVTLYTYQIRDGRFIRKSQSTKAIPDEERDDPVVMLRFMKQL